MLRAQEVGNLTRRSGNVPFVERLTPADPSEATAASRTGVDEIYRSPDGREVCRPVICSMRMRYTIGT